MYLFCLFLFSTFIYNVYADTDRETQVDVSERTPPIHTRVYLPLAKQHESLRSHNSPHNEINYSYSKQHSSGANTKNNYLMELTDFEKLLNDIRSQSKYGTNPADFKNYNNNWDDIVKRYYNSRNYDYYNTLNEVYPRIRPKARPRLYEFYNYYYNPDPYKNDNLINSDLINTDDYYELPNHNKYRDAISKNKKPSESQNQNNSDEINDNSAETNSANWSYEDNNENEPFEDSKESSNSPSDEVENTTENETFENEYSNESKDIPFVVEPPNPDSNESKNIPFVVEPPNTDSNDKYPNVAPVPKLCREAKRNIHKFLKELFVNLNINPNGPKNQNELHYIYSAIRNIINQTNIENDKSSIPKGSSNKNKIQVKLGKDSKNRSPQTVSDEENSSENLMYRMKISKDVTKDNLISQPSENVKKTFRDEENSNENLSYRKKISKKDEKNFINQPNENVNNSDSEKYDVSQNIGNNQDLDSSDAETIKKSQEIETNLKNDQFFWNMITLIIKQLKESANEIDLEGRRSLDNLIGKIAPDKIQDMSECQILAFNDLLRNMRNVAVSFNYNDCPN